MLSKGMAVTLQEAGGVQIVLGHHGAADAAALEARCVRLIELCDRRMT